MAAKKSKTIKQLEKQIKKLNARIDEMSREIKGLQGDKEATQEAWPNPKFSEDEVEMAEEMAEDAGEVEDILEKKHK